MTLPQGSCKVYITILLRSTGWWLRLKRKVFILENIYHLFTPRMINETVPRLKKLVPLPHFSAGTLLLHITHTMWQPSTCPCYALGAASSFPSILVFDPRIPKLEPILQRQAFYSCPRYSGKVERHGRIIFLKYYYCF